MEYLPSTAPSVARLIGELNKLPGVGPKSAQRLAYHLIRLPDAAEALADAVMGVKERVFFCSRCQNLTDEDPCAVCSDPDATRPKYAWWKAPWTSWLWSAPTATVACTMSSTASSPP